MPDRSVDLLRQQLRERGYLSHGIERWFALDPWRSRAFWLELLTVAAKGGLLVALFAVLPLVAVMLFRNHPLSASETLAMTLFYGVTALAVSASLLIAIALVLRLRPALAIDTPRALLGISFTASALLTAAIALWWLRFDTAPGWPELLTGLALIVLFFLMTTVAVSAALLSFSIYELQRVPALHARRRGVPMSIAATILIAILFLPTYFAQDTRAAAEAPMVVTRPPEARVALIAVDGLTFDVFRAHPALSHDFGGEASVPQIPAESATERWASVGTGVPTRIHGVRAVEGVRIRGGAHLIQAVSAGDVVLRHLAEFTGLATREALPPTVRRRDYVWEVFAGRGVPAVAVNWWTSGDVKSGALDAIGQATVFGAAALLPDSARAIALRVDATAARMFLDAVGRTHPRFATVYLPALDIVLNRLPLDPSEKLALSVRIVDAVDVLVSEMRKRDYDVILVGSGVIAWTGQTRHPPYTAYDVAPTLCALMGFPASLEMPGHSFADLPELPRVATFGRRATAAEAGKVNEEYYRNLKSLGYIR